VSLVNLMMAIVTGRGGTILAHVWVVVSNLDGAPLKQGHIKLEMVS